MKCGAWFNDVKYLERRESSGMMDRSESVLFTLVQIRYVTV